MKRTFDLDKYVASFPACSYFCVVVDFDISFINLVWRLVKLALAAMPMPVSTSTRN